MSDLLELENKCATTKIQVYLRLMGSTSFLAINMLKIAKYLC